MAKLLIKEIQNPDRVKQIVIFDRCKGIQKCLNLMIILGCALLLNLVNIVSSEPAWFQVCDETQRYLLNTLDCKLGLWLNRTIKVNCVCLNGVWILSDGLCDEEPMILVGSGDCFSVGKEIKSVKFLGNRDKPFSSATYVVSKYFDSYVDVWGNQYNPSVESAQTYVVSISPSTGFQRSDREVCLTTTDKDLRKPVHIWKNERRVSDRFKAVSTGSCYNPTRYDFHVGFGELYQASAVVTDMSTEDCSSKCLNKRMMSTESEEKKKQMKVTGRNLDNKLHGRQEKLNETFVAASTSLRLNAPRRTNIKWDPIYSLKTKLGFLFPAPGSEGTVTTRTKGGQRLSGIGNTDENTAHNIFLFRLNMSMTSLAHSREIREQSLRMIQSQTNALLLNKASARVNTQEYDYFQKARQIFIGSTPSDFIPPHIVNGLTRMFRLLLWESHDKFVYRESSNPESHERILNSLENCRENMTQTPIYFIKGNNNKMQSTHACPEQTKRTVLNYTNDKVLTATQQVPAHLAFNVTDLDVSVELAWKIFMFTFYHCSHFFETTANDHSEMAEKIQSLFNYKVLKRWYEPEDFNNALKVVLPTLDINLFGWAVDRVVGTARQVSPWSTWLARPVLPITEPDLPSHMRNKRSRNMRGRQMSKQNPSTSSRSLRKASKRSRFNFWSDMGTCIHSFTDPVIVLGYEAKSDCYLAKIRDT